MTDRVPSILIVDDDEDICLNFNDIFTDLGYDVDVAHEGFAALEMIKRRPYPVNVSVLNELVHLATHAERQHAGSR